MTSKASKPSKRSKKSTPTETVVPIIASDERSGAQPKEHGDFVRPKQGKDVAPSGAMNKSTVHQTESKVNHPMGKTRSGVAQRRGR